MSYGREFRHKTSRCYTNVILVKSASSRCCRGYCAALDPRRVSGPAQTVYFDGWFVNCLVMDTTRTVSRQFHGTFLWLVMLGGNVKQNTSTDKHFSSYNL